MKITIRNARLAFAKGLFEAGTVNGEGKPAFSASFIIPPDHPQIGEIEAAIETVAKEKWGAKADAMLKIARAKDMVFLHDGDSKEYDGFAGNKYISARSPVRPLLADRDKTVLVESDGVLYSGCYVYATVEVWAQDNGYGKRINAQLQTVQFFRDGDAFGGARTGSADDLADLEEGADSGLA